MRILLVDDESLIRMDLRDQLEAAGHEVVGEGKNGVEALSLARQHKPDVILMDVKMPVMDGFEAIKEIKSYDKDAKIIIVSADIQEFSKQKARENGAIGFINKPINKDTISMMLNKLGLI